ncbi:MAG: O-antigen ligase family protein [Clostridiales bacterium]|nr:O-antigen ligase family protein [Clostridiales bacterium]
MSRFFVNSAKYRYLYNFAFLFLLIAVAAEVFLLDMDFGMLAVIEYIGLILASFMCIVRFRRGRIDESVLFIFSFILYVVLLQFLNISNIKLGALANFLGGPVLLLLYAVISRRITVKANRALLVFSAVVGVIASIMICINNQNGFADRTKIHILTEYTTNANAIAYPIALSLLIMLYGILRHYKRFNLLKKAVLVASMGINAYTLYFVQSRGAIVSGFIGALVLLLTNIRSKRFAKMSIVVLPIIAAIGIVAFVYLSNERNIDFLNSNGRTDLWLIALSEWVKHPVFGNNVYLTYGIHPSSHNLYFDLLSQVGIVGFVLFALIIATLFKRIKNKRSRAFVAFAFCQSLIDANSMVYILLALVCACAADVIETQDNINYYFSKRVRKHVIQRHSAHI